MLKIHATAATVNLLTSTCSQRLLNKGPDGSRSPSSRGWLLPGSDWKSMQTITRSVIHQYAGQSDTSLDESDSDWYQIFEWQICNNMHFYKHGVRNKHTYHSVYNTMVWYNMIYVLKLKYCSLQTLANPHSNFKAPRFHVIHMCWPLYPAHSKAQVHKMYSCQEAKGILVITRQGK